MGLAGTWKNEFGSVMDICVDEQGVISGIYSSHTGATGRYRVTGIADTQPDPNSQCVAFSISWRPLDAAPADPSFHWVSGFAGQLQVVDGEEVLYTTYLLEKNTPPSDNWEATAVDKCTFRRFPPLPLPPLSKHWVAFDLQRGKMMDNGATPWFAGIALGTPAQTLKYMLDTGTTHTWVTSSFCTTDACLVHQAFCPDKSSTSKKISTEPVSINFGPWGKMYALLYEDRITLPVMEQRPQENDLTLPVNIYLSTDYDGDQFAELACDGGIAIPRLKPKTSDSTELLPKLKEEGIIDQAVASFWFDPQGGKGQVRMGTIDPARFDPKSVNLLTVTPLPDPFDYLWTVPLEMFLCGGRSVLSHIPIVLDTGSSVFKGDPNLIQKIRCAITQCGALPCIIKSSNPDFGSYPVVSLQIGAFVYSLTPSQYFIETEQGVWELAFQEMKGLDGFLLAGSVFLDTVYSAFYYEPDRAGDQKILLAAPVKPA